MRDKEKEARILAANPELADATFGARVKRWDAIQNAGLQQGLAPGSQVLADWIAYWVTEGREGRLPE